MLSRHWSLQECEEQLQRRCRRRAEGCHRLSQKETAEAPNFTDHLLSIPWTMVR
jgi:hypothetical protein